MPQINRKKQAAQKAAQEKAKLSNNHNNHDHWVWFGEENLNNDYVNVENTTQTEIDDAVLVDNNADELPDVTGTTSSSNVVGGFWGIFGYK